MTSFAKLNTCTVGDRFCPLHLFFFSRKKNNKNGTLRIQIWCTCATNRHTSCVKILTSYVTKLGHQVRSKSGVQTGTGFKQFNIVLPAQYWSQCFETFGMRYWSGYLQNLCVGFFILVTSGQVNFLPGPLPYGKMTLLPITFEPKVRDE